MRHVIVIESPDDITEAHGPQGDFEDLCIKSLEAFANLYLSEYIIIHSRFFVPSAVEAVKEIYNAE